MSNDLLIFDDFPNASENVLFLSRLRRALAGHIGESVRICVTRTIDEADLELRNGNTNAAIFDLMAAVPRGFRSFDGRQNHDVSSLLAGVELLQRCRAGSYGSAMINIPIFCRTARGEDEVRQLCYSEGASGYFLVGTEDTALIARVVAHYRSCSTKST